MNQEELLDTSHSSINRSEFEEGHSMTSTPPPTSHRSTDDLESFLSDDSSPAAAAAANSVNTTISSINDNRSLMSSSEMNNHPDEELPSFGGYAETYTSSDVASLEDVDLGEQPSDGSNGGTTNHAIICNPNRRRDYPHQKRRPVKPETPKEQFCCCYPTDNHIDYDLDDQPAFEDGSCGIQLLRSCRLLAPRPEENPVKRKIRFLLWWTVLLDLAVAVVSLLSFGTTMMTCCGEPVFAVPGIDIYQVIQIFLYAYLGVVMLEILPVVREGCIPWNLMNPIFGFALGFVLFLNGTPMTALCIWILQIVSVALEFVTYRHYSILLKESKQRLELAERQWNQKPRRGYQLSKKERVRRELRSRHTKALFRSRKHMIGVTINVLLVISTLLLIVYVARREGMCIKDGGTPSVFLFNDEMECSASEGTRRRYETCDLDMFGTECYFPFF